MYERRLVQRDDILAILASRIDWKNQHTIESNWKSKGCGASKTATTYVKPVHIPRVLKSVRSIVIRAEIYGDAINSTIYGAIVVNK